MKKTQIDSSSPVASQLAAIKETLEAITGVRGGKIQRTKGIQTSSVGVDVASAGPTQVATTAELTQVITRIKDIETILNALIDRMNTP